MEGVAIPASHQGPRMRGLSAATAPISELAYQRLIHGYGPCRGCDVPGTCYLQLPGEAMDITSR